MRCEASMKIAEVRKNDEGYAITGEEKRNA
jgi:hypothetical protein